MPGQDNNDYLHDYYYSLEIAELFEGKLRGKIVHFRIKSVDLNQEEAQYFLDVTKCEEQSRYG
jgi:hypothetical protein